MEQGWIEEDLYRKILKSIPIASVDVLSVCKGMLLLLLRKNEPGKGLWWTPGGRVRKGETLEAAATRELMEETGLRPMKIEKIGVMSHFWPKVHFVTSFFLAEVEDKSVIMNDEHSDYVWVTQTSDEFHPYLTHMIAESKVW